MSTDSPRFVLSVAFMCVTRVHFGGEMFLKNKTLKRTNFENLNQKTDVDDKKYSKIAHRDDANQSTLAVRTAVDCDD